MPYVKYVCLKYVRTYYKTHNNFFYHISLLNKDQLDYILRSGGGRADQYKYRLSLPKRHIH